MTNEEAKRRLEVWLKCMDCPEDKQCYDSHLHSTCEYTDYCDETPVSEAVKVAIKALEQQPCDTVSRGVLEQIMWERDIAIEQLRKLGYELGQKIESCDDAVNRQVAIDAFERFIHELGIEDEPYNYGEMALSVKNVPPVTPQQKYGKWIKAKPWMLDNTSYKWECSECEKSERFRHNYCPNCGARMESEVSE